VTLFAPPTGRVYLWTHPDHWVGPVHLVPHPTSASQWIVDPVALQHPIDIAAAAPALYVACCTFEGTRRRFHIPQTKLGQREGRVDWSADDVLLKRVLRSIRQMDPEFTDKLGVSMSLINHAVERLKQHPFVGGEPEVIEQRLRRAASLVRRIGGRVDMARHIEDEVIRLPVFQAELARRVALEATEAVARAMEAAHGDLAEVTARVARLGDEEATIWEGINVLTGEREAEAGRIAAQRAELARERDALERHQDEIRQQFEDRVKTLVASPGALLADLAILRLVAPGFDGARPAGTTGEPVSAPVPTPAPAPRARPVGIAQPRGEATIEDPDALRQALRLAARRRGIPARALRAIHGTILGGGVPVVAGADATAAVAAYADAVTAGAVLWVPVAPSMLEPADLLGRPDGRGRFAPHSAGLVDLLLDAYAAGPDGPLRLVVLDGVNRAPVDAYLAPVLEAMRSALVEEHPRRLPLCHPASLDVDDPYAAVPHLPWPSTVLLAGTWAHGPATLPPSAAFWETAALVPLSYYVRQVADVQSGHSGAGQGVTGAGAHGGDAVVTAARADAFARWRRTPPPAFGVALQYQELLDAIRPEIDLGTDRVGAMLAAVLQGDGIGNGTDVGTPGSGEFTGGSVAADVETVDTLREVFFARVAPRAAGTDSAARLEATCPTVFREDEARYREALALVCRLLA
jgi:phage-related protein